MSAFDGKNKVARKVVDPRTDHKLPASKSLLWKAITSPSALDGTMGQHCELVHGDQWHQIKGNVTENVQEDVATAIVGNHSHNVTGNQTTSIIGDAQAMHVGTCTKTYVDSKIETFGKDHFSSMSGNTQYLFYESAFQGYALKFQISYYQVQFNGASFNIITNPFLAMVTSSLAFPSGGPAGTPSGTSIAPTGTTTTSGNAAGVGGFLSGMFFGISVTLNTGLSLSADLMNLGASALIHASAKPLAADFKALGAKLFGAAVDAGGAKAKAHARAGVPPHPPLTG